MPIYVVGMDYGTDSVRAVLYDITNKCEIHNAVSLYPRWAEGKYSSGVKSQFRHHPLDYIECTESVLEEISKKCPDPKAICSIGIDTTASTPCLVDSNLTPLSLLPQFAENPDAMFILWKDHTSQEESKEIVSYIKEIGAPYLNISGGQYSSECYWSKMLHVLRGNKELQDATFCSLELCDWITVMLTGCKDIQELRASRCVAGAKQMWAEEWGGYPPKEFFDHFDKSLWKIVENYPKEKFYCHNTAGKISKEYAAKYGFSENLIVSVAQVDSHSGGVGAGCCHKKVAITLGTSAGAMVVVPKEQMQGVIVDGVFSQVLDSILPDMIGFEVGLSAFGDIYGWFKGIISLPAKEILGLEDDIYDSKILPYLNEKASRIEPRLDAPIATDYLNGRRSPNPKDYISAAIAGLKLGTKAEDIYYSLVEASAFAFRSIFNLLERYNIEIDEIVAIGGISQKSTFAMQMLSDVLGKSIKVADCPYATAMGAVINASVAAGIFESVTQAQNALNPKTLRIYTPNTQHKEIIDKRYRLYQTLSERTEEILN